MIESSFASLKSHGWKYCLLICCKRKKYYSSWKTSWKVWIVTQVNRASDRQSKIPMRYNIMLAFRLPIHLGHVWCGSQIALAAESRQTLQAEGALMAYATKWKSRSRFSVRLVKPWFAERSHIKHALILPPLLKRV
jgi:hypothetical protein